MEKKVLKKVNGITADVNINTDACYIFLNVSKERLWTEGVIDIEYSCRTAQEDRFNTNISPFKLLNGDGKRVVNIIGFVPTEPINENNYAEQCKIAFCQKFGWDLSDVTIEDEMTEPIVDENVDPLIP